MDDDDDGDDGDDDETGGDEDDEEDEEDDAHAMLLKLMMMMMMMMMMMISMRVQLAVHQPNKTYTMPRYQGAPWLSLVQRRCGTTISDMDLKLFFSVEFGNAWKNIGTKK